MVTTLQAVSGAGYPGVASLDILGNVIPFIGGEEEKMESETQKILGTLERDDRLAAPGGRQRARRLACRWSTVTPSRCRSSSSSGRRSTTCATRCAGSAAGRRSCGCRRAPPAPIVYLRKPPNRPQPRLDVDRGGGMTVSVGRLRPCPMLGNKFVALGHNTVRGAAGAAMLNAELMVARDARLSFGDRCQDREIEGQDADVVEINRGSSVSELPWSRGQHDEERGDEVRRDVGGGRRGHPRG